MPGNLQDVSHLPTNPLSVSIYRRESPSQVETTNRNVSVLYPSSKHRQTSLTFLQKNEERGELPWAGQMNVATRDTRGQHPAQLVTRCQPRHMRPVTS